MVGLLGILE